MTRVIRAEQWGPRVVQAPVAEAGEQAQRLLEDARARAQATLATAEARVALAEQEGRERGHAEAHAELSSRVEQLERARAQLLTSLEPQVIELAVAAAQHLLGAELTLRPEAIEGILCPLLERLRNAHTVTVHVHPDDARWLDATLPASLAGTRAQVKFQADPDIARGGCLVVSDIGALDARLEPRLAILSDALKQTAHADGE